MISFSVFGGMSEQSSVQKMLESPQTGSPREVIESITKDLKKLIDEKPAQNTQKLKTIISSTMKKAFDFNNLSEKTIKKEFWKKLSKSQKTRFKTLFSELLTKLYSKKTEEILAKVDLDFKKESVFGNRATVDYIIKRKDVDIKISYEMCKGKSLNSSENPWKICNVTFDGADLARTYALQFNSKLENSITLKKTSLQRSFDQLLAQLDKKVKTI